MAMAEPISKAASKVTSTARTDTELPLERFARGKVRDTYAINDEELLMVATDRLSAFDHVLPNGIPDRGKVLTQLSIFWFSQTDTFQANHLISGMVPDLPASLKGYREELAGRFMIVRKAKRIDVEPDLSNAVPFLAAALATGGEVTVSDWPADSLQPATRIIELLRSMGADARRDARGLRVTGPGQIRGVGADLSEAGELTPVLTALAALAGSPSEFSGIGHLRRHESDRLAARAGEIGKLGGEVTELPDGLRITPSPLRAGGVVFDSHDDHRLVMAAAVLGLVTDGLMVHNAATVGKTFPGFSQVWAQLLTPVQG